MRHPSEQTIRAWARGQSTPRPRDAKHLDGCLNCRQTLGLVRALAVADSPLTRCPEDEALIQLVDTQDITGVVAEHVGACLPCASTVERLSLIAAMGRLPVAPPAAAVPSLLERLRALVTFEMPIAVRLTTRGGVPDTARAEYSVAMAAYREESWDDAERRLKALQTRGERRSGVSLYLGACQLRRGDFASAATVLADAVRDRPRSAEAHWYYAQALLGSGRAEPALIALSRATRLRGPIANRARWLAERISQVLASTSLQSSIGDSHGRQ